MEKIATFYRARFIVSGALFARICVSLLRLNPAKILIPLLLPFALISCQLRPLLDPQHETKIDIRINSTGIDNIDRSIYNSQIPVPDILPEMIRVLFYNESGEKLVSETFVSDNTRGRSGEVHFTGAVSVLPGTYRILAYSFGAENTYVSDYDNYHKVNLYTDPVSKSMLDFLSVKSEDSDVSSVREQPEFVFAAREDQEKVPYHNGEFTIFTEADPVLEVFYLQVKVDGIQYLSSATAVLSSMAGRANLATKGPDYSDAASIVIPLMVSEDKGEPVICNLFNTFGRIPDSSNGLKVTFNIKTVGGNTEAHEFDISDLFLSEDALNHHWLLLNETIHIDPVEPMPGPEHGDYDPYVKDWEEIEGDVDI